MKTELQQNEQVIKQGAANLQKGLETVGGMPYTQRQVKSIASCALVGALGRQQLTQIRMPS